MMNSPFTRPTRTAPSVAPNGMSERASAATAALMPITSGSFSLSAENTSAMICVSFRNPSGNMGRMGRSICRAVRISFALDKAAGNAAARIGVFTIIDSEREKVDAFPLVGGGHRGCQHDRLARSDECRAGGLLSHAAGLKDQSLAARKLDGYFLFGRHRVLFSFFTW